MTIEITNTQNVINEANSLVESTIELESVKDSIEFALNEVAQYWEQTQADAEFFYEDLKKNVETLNEVIGCNKDFANVITNYAEKQEKTSQATI